MELNDLQDETWRGNVVEKVSDDLWKEFNLEGRSTKPVFEEVMREIESIELNFSQTPFFLINENVFNECLNNFIQIFSFDFGLENSFKLEKEIYLQGKFEPQYSDEKRIFKDINPTAILQEKSKNETRGMTFKSQANFSKDSNLMDENLVKLEENCNEVKVEEDDCNKVKIEEKNSFHSSLEKKSQTKETLQSERKNKTKIEEEVKQNKDVYLKEKKENSLQPDHKNEIEKHFNKLMKKMVKLESIGPCNLGKNKLFAIGTGQGEFNDLNNVSGEDSHPKFSASTDLSNSSNRIQWNVKQTSYYSEQTDHFSSDFQFGENEESTICLLGQNNKALYMTEKGKCELVTLDFEFINKEDKKGYVLKNFACCVAIDKNKVFYTGGGFSNDSYLLEFKSKTQVQVYTLPKMSQKRCWHGVIYSEPYAYIIGIISCFKLLNYDRRI